VAYATCFIKLFVKTNTFTCRE